MNKDQILQKNSLLEAVETQLKGEYIGLEQQITEIFKAIKPWYIFPESITRPLIVNLWGMTGVGKTSLVRRIAELLKLSEKESFGEIDFGAVHKNHFDGLLSLKPFVKKSGKPLMFLIDEFQLGRTISEYQTEIDRSSYRELWSLLSDGVIVQDQETYLRILESFIYNQEPINPLTSYQLSKIYDLLGEKLFENKELFLQEHSKNPKSFYLKIKNFALNLPLQQTLDFRKSLIFITGNLDIFSKEQMGLDPDFISPDELHQQHLEISNQQIKKSLLSLFRPEQVSRLGNIHLVYPSLNYKGYHKILKKLISQSLLKFKSELSGIQVKVDESLVKIILKEGIVPSQGVRSIISTYQNLVENNFHEIVLRVLKHSATTKVSLKFSNNKLIILGFKNTIPLWKSEVLLSLPNTKNKESLHPEPIRSLVAHHEAAHAVVGYSLFKKLPLQIRSKTSEGNIGGFVAFSPAAVRTKLSLSLQLSYILAGFAAEKMVYGENNISTGAYQDLKQATELASSMVTELGMGSHLGRSKLENHAPHFLSAFKEQDDKEVESLLQNALMRAEEILRQQNKLYQAVAKKLKVSTCMEVADFKVAVKTHYRRLKK